MTTLNVENEKLYTLKSKLDNGMFVKAWWRRAPSIANPIGKILAGIELTMEPNLTISNGGQGKDLIHADFTINKFATEPQDIWDTYVVSTDVPVVFSDPEPEVTIEVDLDFAIKLTAHDWFYSFSDSANVYKNGKAREEALEEEAKDSELKTEMLKLACEYRADTVSGKKPTKPIWL